MFRHFEKRGRTAPPPLLSAPGCLPFSADCGHDAEQTNRHGKQQDRGGYVGDGGGHGRPTGGVLGVDEVIDHAEYHETDEQGDCAIDNKFGHVEPLYTANHRKCSADYSVTYTINTICSGCQAPGYKVTPVTITDPANSLSMGTFSGQVM